MKRKRTMFRRVLSLSVLLCVCPLPAVLAGDAGTTIDRFFEAYRSQEVHRMLEVYAPDAVFIDISQRHHVEGVDELREFLTRLVAVHHNMDARERRRVVGEGVAVVDYVYTGTLSGESLRELTGKETCRDTAYEIPVTSWFEVEGGRIVKQTDFIDLATLEEVRARASGEQR